MHDRLFDKYAALTFGRPSSPNSHRACREPLDLRDWRIL